MTKNNTLELNFFQWLILRFSKAARGRPEGPTERSVFKIIFVMLAIFYSTFWHRHQRSGAPDRKKITDRLQLKGPARRRIFDQKRCWHCQRYRRSVKSSASSSVAGDRKEKRKNERSSFLSHVYLKRRKWGPKGRPSEASLNSFFVMLAIFRVLLAEKTLLKSDC